MERNILEWINGVLEKALLRSGVSERFVERFESPIILCITVLLSFAVMEIIYRIILFACRKIEHRKHYEFLQHLIKGKRVRKLTYTIPPLLVEITLPVILEERPVLLQYSERITWIWFVVCVVISINTLLTTIGESAFTNSKYHDKPIKGFLQISRITAFIIAVIIVISILTNKSPVYLIGGLGAFAAVLMLIAKDSIMGFVGGFLLLENDMVRLGDWIEIPGTGINGSVFDISLTIVKVRNWDNTIATIPPYSLINESFINWRGMSESGGRRIARGYTIKLDNIKPCSTKMLERLKKLDKELEVYIIRKYEQYMNGEICNTSNPEGLPNGTIDTNAGLFRAYADIYLRKHPMIRQDMTIMVRTLEPTDTGLPIQFYCFTKTTEWSEYESIQSEIMEHFASVMPIFELYPFQSSGARDTIISGLLEGNFPIERIEGVPVKTIK
ncbi:MAG: mechanosensitive ion channel [Bacteroidaceae bacterium]|nr:mechanosensitive ion channel [Bacteroidaceae bacterium]